MITVGSYSFNKYIRLAHSCFSPLIHSSNAQTTESVCKTKNEYPHIIILCRYCRHLFFLLSFISFMRKPQTTDIVCKTLNKYHHIIIRCHLLRPHHHHHFPASQPPPHLQHLPLHHDYSLVAV